MATLKLDRKKPDTAIPLIEKTINTLFPIGIQLTGKKPPEIGDWKMISTNENGNVYERIK